MSNHFNKIIFLHNCELVALDKWVKLRPYFPIHISNEGSITIKFKNDLVDTVSYNMDEYTREEVLSNWYRERLSRYATIYIGHLH